MYMEKKNYSDAMKQLEDIVRRMESGELDIDSLTKELKTAQSLIKLCKDKLYKTEEEIKKIMEPGEITK
ncbi:MAG: exodeoxyribonuclease VII small subunit [Prevotella sp.]|nr:exodeoxyribonuclease VII small subunit [Prevotella sp.]MBQ7451235.1 exodeoxyribonuclease VII small subunit [Prevotella sp.]MBQ8115859.1 exodeoxyribonuclease VII small subunit [Prevotella sp.]MBR4269202.1 exodeoxyribonuclease VII small subunit [Prevotella sp.]